MARTPSGDTAARIQAVALELFATQGFEKTSLQQIAGRVGLTKPALYYHFPSKEALILSLVRPLSEEFGALLDEAEAAGTVRPRELLGFLFDVTYRHQAILVALIRELSVISDLNLGDDAFAWRRRVQHLLAGPDGPLAAQVRAVVAIGGLQDCIVLFPDTPLAQLRPAAVDAACAALGLPAATD